VTPLPASAWNPLEADATTIAGMFSEPLMVLAEGVVPAFVLRGAYPEKDCQALMERFEARGYFRRETVGAESQLSGGSYLDLGTSLGRMGADRKAFFAHAERTHALFPRLFEGLADPVATIYRNLFALAAGKQVRTAVSTDGRLYGPAIFRIYQSEEGHRPHYDSVRRRSTSNYEVARFAHQFAGVLCVKKGSVGGDSVLHRAKAEGEVEDVLGRGEFEPYARDQDIPSVRVELDAGDLYFFYTENVHEVPRTERADMRVVLAVFIAMSPDDKEIYVWS
jgi:hypothetical protein